MSVYLYQIQYDEASKPSEASGFRAFDVRDNPEFLKREMAHMMRFYDEIVSKGNDSDLYGLFSPKFNEKSGLSSADVMSFVEKNADADVCLFNPFPMAVYKNLNVWQQGEECQPNLIRLASQMFKAAGFDFDPASLHRNSVQNTVYCNYWVAKKSFFDGFIPFVRKMDQAINDMPDDVKSEYFSDAKYISKACYYPFLFERLLSAFLYKNNGSHKVYPFKFSYEQVVKSRIGTVDKFFYRDFSVKFDKWETLQQNPVEIADAVSKIRLLCYPNVGNLFFSKFIRSVLKRLNIYRMKYELDFLDRL